MLTDDELAVLADELQQRGDPHGELIGLQLALAQLTPEAPAVRRRVLERRIAACLDRHHDVFFGALAAHLDRLSRPDLRYPALVVRAWHHGFIDALELRDVPEIELGVALQVLGGLPIARRMRTLAIEVLEASKLGLCAFDPMPSVRRVVVRSSWHTDRPRVDLAPFVARLTGLDDLSLYLDGHVVQPFASPTLRRLSIALGEDVLTAELPALEELDVWGAPDPELLDRYPRVTRVSLTGPVAADWLAELVRSPRFAQLRSFRLGSLETGEDHLAVLVAHADRLGAIELDISFSPLRCRREAIDAARRVLPPNVILR